MKTFVSFLPSYKNFLLQIQNYGVLKLAAILELKKSKSISKTRKHYICKNLYICYTYTHKHTHTCTYICIYVYILRIITYMYFCFN